MGRPLKTGLDFFSTDIDMDEDDKLIDLLNEIGTIEGTGIVWHLLNSIYKNGYFLEWNDSVLKKLCRRKQLDKAKMEIGIQYLTGVNMSYTQRLENATFFDYEIFKTYKILTSRGIQKRYLLAAARRSQIIFDRRLILLDHYEDIKPYKKRYESEHTDTKGYWTDLDTKSYLLTFSVNGLICDNTNKDSEDTNIVSVNTNTIQIDNVQNNGDSVNTSAQRKGKRKESTGKEIEIEKEKKEIVFKGFSPATTKPDTKLYNSIKETFLSKNNGVFTSWPKEGKSIKELIKKAEIRYPDNPSGFIQGVIEEFYLMTCGNDKFWKDQPFTPSTLNASGIFDRVIKKLQSEQPVKRTQNDIDFLKEVIF